MHVVNIKYGKQIQMDFSFLCSLDAKIHSISQILQTIKIFF